MSATLTADSFIQPYASNQAFAVPPISDGSTKTKSILKNIDSHSLSRARQFYIARSLTSPSQSMPNNKLNIIRKLAWLLVLFQLLDGFFTIVGIRYFGTEIEGNPLIRQLIGICGADFGISIVKLLTILIIFSICVVGFRVTWLTKALSTVAGVYFIFALLPWSLLFSSYFLGY